MSRRTSLRTRTLVLATALAVPLLSGAGAWAQTAPDGDHGNHGRPEAGHPGSSGQHPGQPDHPCTEPEHDVYKQGPSCRVANGLYKVRSSDGSFTYTHGPDLLSSTSTPRSNGQTGNLGSAAARNPVCTSANPHGDYGIRAVVAVPSDGSQTMSADGFRAMLKQIDGAFNASAVESGSANGGDLVFECDSTGTIRVDVVRLSHTASASTFSTITGDLRNLGYTSPSRNVAVYFTATMSGIGGEGSLNTDSTNSAGNANNTGGRFAIDYGVTGAETMMHEIGHNLGAVQPASPYSTGTGGHCWEGQDVMCYNDKGSTDPGYISWVCNDFDHFDCGHDDYFDAVIGAGQGVSSTGWLASHFNIAACYDVFVVNRACTGTTTDTTPPSVSAPTQTVQYLGQASNGLVPVSYGWSGSDASGIAQYDVWISTNGTWYQMALGSAAPVAGTWNLTPGSTYQMAVRAKDGANNWSGYAYGPAFTVDAFQESSSAIGYTGSWPAYSGSYFGGRQYSSGVTSASAKITFTGRGFAWYAATATNRGQAYVWVDGTYIGSPLDTYSASTYLGRAVLTRNWTTSGTHTVQVQVVGTSGRPTIDVDAFVALR